MDESSSYLASPAVPLVSLTKPIVADTPHGCPLNSPPNRRGTSVPSCPTTADESVRQQSFCPSSCASEYKSLPFGCQPPPPDASYTSTTDGHNPSALSSAGRSEYGPFSPTSLGHPSRKKYTSRGLDPVLSPSLLSSSCGSAKYHPTEERLQEGGADGRPSNQRHADEGRYPAASPTPGHAPAPPNKLPSAGVGMSSPGRPIKLADLGGTPPSAPPQTASKPLDLTQALQIRDVDAGIDLARGINPEIDTSRVRPSGLGHVGKSDDAGPPPFPEYIPVGSGIPASE